MQSPARTVAASFAQLSAAALVPSKRGRFIGAELVRSDQDDWSDWRAPTLSELADRIEHQFGALPALASIGSLGFASDEPLTPPDVREVCDLLGVPAADFGLDF